MVAYGGLGVRAAVVQCEAVGFPRFKLRSDPPDGEHRFGITKYRDAAHIHGWIASLANWREGTLELVVDPPERDPDPLHSPWEGMCPGLRYGAATGSSGWSVNTTLRTV